ncbi:unnamed protein product [Bursaphelenchus xylophilus]|uniref:(pine wood nematode) hypothetical protein n=1 Tax=Bursaphelenchus xylophilus TaxID=6326 RepID=A0A7I8X9Y3_BURXY|nr:unnamed protein product [Bursaphelenchus xylophilus]CAG9132017.1 unnamed protein product [Bursaphelenchus xylophilus]
MSSHYKSDGSPGIPLTWCRILVSGGSLVHPAPLPAGGEIAQREAVSPCGSGRSGPISEVCLQLRAECSGRLEGPLIFFLFDLKSWNYMQGEWKQNKLLIVGFGFVKFPTASEEREIIGKLKGLGLREDQGRYDRYGADLKTMAAKPV